MVGQVQQAVMAALHTGEIRKFVHFPAGLHTEMADGLKGNILRQHAGIEFAGLFDDLTGEIFLLDGNG